MQEKYDRIIIFFSIKMELNYKKSIEFKDI